MFDKLLRKIASCKIISFKWLIMLKMSTTILYKTLPNKIDPSSLNLIEKGKDLIGGFWSKAQITVICVN